jgi:hypothetical protein
LSVPAAPAILDACFTQFLNNHYVYSFSSMAERPLTQTRPFVSIPSIPWRVRRWWNITLLFLASTPLLLFLVLPLLTLIGRVPLTTLLTNLLEPQVAQAIGNS